MHCLSISRALLARIINRHQYIAAYKKVGPSPLMESLTPLFITNGDRTSRPTDQHHQQSQLLQHSSNQTSLKITLLALIPPFLFEAIDQSTSQWPRMYFIDYADNLKKMVTICLQKFIHKYK